jgi:hypothetical protein
MLRHCGNGSLVGAVTKARRLTLTALVIVISGAIASPHAIASANTPASRHGFRTSVNTGGDHGNSGHLKFRGGNGRFNKNYWEAFSPSFNSGPQQVQNVNLSGNTNTQIAFCRKRHRFCKISQKFRSRW